MNRWANPQISLQFHLTHYRSRKILSVPAFVSAGLCAPEFSPPKELLWTNCVYRMDRETVYLSKRGFLNKNTAPYFQRQPPTSLLNTAVLYSHTCHLLFCYYCYFFLFARIHPVLARSLGVGQLSPMRYGFAGTWYLPLCSCGKVILREGKMPCLKSHTEINDRGKH